MAEDAHHRWPDRLEALVERSSRYRGVMVLAQTSSTQDAARRLGAGDGFIVTSLRQTGGRGRLGSRWDDHAGEGLAVTITLPAAPPERLCAAVAVGVARALERFLGAPVSIKWPNDVHVAGRKIAGILVETDRGHARIGVGINVRQRDWPEGLRGRATSLAQEGVEVERIDVLEALLEEIDRALDEPLDALAATYDDRNALRGRHARFRVGEEILGGRVRRIDPRRGVEIECDGEVRWLPGETTRVLEIEPGEADHPPRALDGAPTPRPAPRHAHRPARRNDPDGTASRPTSD